MTSASPYGPLPSARIGPHVGPAQPGRRPGQREAGLPAAAAVALLIVLSGFGAMIDLATGSGLRAVYGTTFLLGCLLGAVLVQRSHRWVPVFAPALIFAGTALLGAFTAGDRGLARTASDAVLRLIEPDKAKWLLAGTGLALAVALLRSRRRT